MQSQAVTYAAVYPDLWCPNRIGEVHSATDPAQTHPLTYTQTGSPAALPKVLEIDCYGCVDWYGYTSPPKPPGEG